MFTNDPENNPLDRIRIYIADWDNSNLVMSDEMLKWIYKKNDCNERKAAKEALEYLLLEYSKYADEKVDEVYYGLGKIYEKFKNALDTLNKGGFGGLGEPYAGGISRSDIKSRKSNSDNLKHDFERRWSKAPPTYDDERS